MGGGGWGGGWGGGGGGSGGGGGGEGGGRWGGGAGGGAGGGRAGDVEGSARAAMWTEPLAVDGATGGAPSDAFLVVFYTASEEVAEVCWAAALPPADAATATATAATASPRAAASDTLASSLAATLSPPVRFRRGSTDALVLKELLGRRRAYSGPPPNDPRSANQKQTAR
jgi:hypothetical protein